MAYTYYNAKTDGTVDRQITSDVAGELYTVLTSQERIAGDIEKRKLFIQSDADITSFVGILNPTPYTSTVFVSANDTDTEADLTGNEVRYGALKVVSSTATSMVLTKNAHYDLVRNGDTLIAVSKAYDINSVVDNGDGTVTLQAASSFSPLPAVGDWVTSVVQLALVTATPRPVWCEERVDAGAAYVSQYAVADILIAD